MIQAVRDALRQCANPSDAANLRRFFKTGPGEYGEGDRFIGVRVPDTRKIARTFRELPLADTQILLESDIHEERLLALIILTDKYRRGTADEQMQIYKLYVTNTQHINNWDLVDTSAEHIVGAYLRDKSRKPLYKLARSASLWERRISIMATFHFIKKDELNETLKVAEMHIADYEDLIHKAVGWMLREVGKRDRQVEEAFLRKHYPGMPRTMLRYAIEKFPEDLRQRYLQGMIT